MPTVFKAWVPNVSGALSFSTIGSGFYPSQPVRANIGDQSVRYIIAYQERNLLDAVFPFLARFRGLRGKFICLCVAHSSDNPLDSSEDLQGRIFIFHDHDQWERDPKGLVHQSQQKLRRFVTAGGGASLRNYFSSTHSQLLQQLLAFSDFFVDFTLNRNGVTTLTIPDNYEALISPNAPSFPGTLADRQHVERIVCSQLFFFLKDLAHNHQHHDPKLDTLVDIHPFHNDIEWRARIIRILYRKVIEYKRNVRPSNYHSSLGMLIYAKSFRGISLKDGISQLQPIIQDDLLEDAIKAGLQNTCFLEEGDQNKQKPLVSFFIPIITFILTVGMLLSLTDYKVDNPDPVLGFLGFLLVCYTAPVIGCFFVYYLYSNMRFNGKMDLATNRFSRTSLVILQPLNQTLAAVIPIICGSLAILAGVIFLNYWYKVDVITDFSKKQQQWSEFVCKRYLTKSK